MNKWRKGQSLFNFLEWLREEKGIPSETPYGRIADPFHLSNEQWDAYLAELV